MNSRDLLNNYYRSLGYEDTDGCQYARQAIKNEQEHISSKETEQKSSEISITISLPFGFGTVEIKNIRKGLAIILIVVFISYLLYHYRYTLLAKVGVLYNFVRR